MARSIRFIAPIESMSGNMSGVQELLYPTDDNSAYDSPEGQVNYARNYKPRYVGTYRRKDGSVSFQVKTRSAVNMTPETKMAMAVLGGVGALTGAILRSDTYKAMATAQMNAENQLGADYKSLREFLDAKIRPALQAKQDRFVITPLGGIFANPWVFKTGSGVTNLQIPNRILVKFWSELADQPQFFYVNGMTGVSHGDETFGEVIASNHNVLTLTTETVDSNTFVKMGSQFLCFDDDDTKYSPIDSEICHYNGAKYYLSDSHGEAAGG